MLYRFCAILFLSLIHILMVEDVHALQTVGGKACGRVLALPQVQAGGNVGRHRHPQRDDQCVLDVYKRQRFS